MRQCTKEDRPAGGAARRSGFWACAENDCKTIIANSCRFASPSFAGEGVAAP